MFRKTLIAGLLVAGLLLPGAGCAPHVAVEKPAPAGAPLAGAKTIAIDEISGPNGNALASSLTYALGWRQGVAVTDKRSAEVILTGSVELFVEDIHGFDQVKTREETGRTEEVTRPDPFVRRDFTVKEPVYQTVVEQVPYTLRRGRIEAVYTLSDRNGGTMQGPLSEVFELSEKYGGINETSSFGLKLDDLPAPNKTVKIMVTELAGRLAARLAPAPTTINYVLDTGEGLLGEADIRRGVRLAEAEKWDQAVEIWAEVLQRDPAHPSAHYNLGVASERLGGQANLREALKQYSQASKTGRNPIYREALTRVTVALRRIEEAERR